MLIYGTFGKFIKRNEKTGDSLFSLHTNKGKILCNGISLSLSSYCPLKITGEYAGEYFNVETIKCCAYNTDVMKQYLSSGAFNGVGDAMADSIVKVFSGDLFAEFNSETNPEALASSVGNSEAVKKCFRRLAGLVTMENTYKYVKGFDGSFWEAMSAYEMYGLNTLPAIKKSPYSMLSFGANYSLCEKIAASNNIEMSDRARTRAVVRNAFFQNHDRGNTKISFLELCQLIHKNESNAGNMYYTSPLFIAEEITTDDYYIEYGTDTVSIYLADDYKNENTIVKNILRLQHSSEAIDNTQMSFAELEERFGVTYSEDQKNAFETLKSSGIKIITGGPGTGKTTILNGILTKYQANNPYRHIVLCAPTGCAARRMQESTGRNAVTIHKLLNIRPFKVQDYCKTEDISADCIVVDECSMIDTFLMARLLSAIKNGALVILLGDEDQLPSVSAGNILHDLIESKTIDIYRLTTIFRQNEGDVIVTNSKKIIQGDFNLTQGKNFVIKTLDSEKEIIEAAISAYEKCCIKGISGTKLYTPVKKSKFETGTIRMNNKLQRINGKPSEEMIDFGFYRFYIGDHVMFIKNNYDKDYFNGEEGIITSIQKHNETCYISIATEDDTITLSGSEISDIELNYAITAHKSQGAECDNAIILIPQNPSTMLKRQLLYVEVTRAKKNVLILSEGDAIKKCISNYMEIKRNTGLKEKLERAMEENYYER